MATSVGDIKMLNSLVLSPNEEMMRNGEFWLLGYARALIITIFYALLVGVEIALFSASNRAAV